MKNEKTFRLAVYRKDEVNWSSIEYFGTCLEIYGPNKIQYECHSKPLKRVDAVMITAENENKELEARFIGELVDSYEYLGSDGYRYVILIEGVHVEPKYRKELAKKSTQSFKYYESSKKDELTQVEVLAIKHLLGK